jgi:RimJ/RimL family protein N-acetyltransferase
MQIEPEGRFTVRPVDDSQLRQLLRVYRACEDFLVLGPEPRASLEMIRADIEHSRAEGGTFCGIWDAQGRIIGVVDFVACGFEGVAEHGFLSLLMISKPHRRQGAGAEVVRAIERRLIHDHGITTMLSAVQTNNRPAIRFWQKMGYAIVSSPEPQQDGTVTYMLSKPLPAGGRKRP